jgi:hypothetical protein
MSAAWKISKEILCPLRNSSLMDMVSKYSISYDLEINFKLINLIYG